MLDYHKGLFVKIEELAIAPAPYPLQHGFCKEKAYRVLGIYNASESSEAYFILPNDSDQIWFISQRHLRAHSITHLDDKSLRISL